MNTPGIFGNFVELVWIVVAAFGGIARYFDTYIKTGIAPRFGLLVAHCIVSGFSGWMVAQVMLRTYPDWAIVAAGIGGFLGTHGLDWISKLVQNKVKITFTVDEKKED